MAFVWDDAFLLAMQAGGAIYSIYEYNSNKKIIEKGKELEKAAFETNLESLRANAAEESLNAMTQLKENVSSQIVMNAARGTASGAGSAQSAIIKSESIIAQDEKTRRINLLMNENNLRAAHVISGLNTLKSETQLGQSLTDQLFKTLPISGLAEKFGQAVGNKKVKNAAINTAGSIGATAGRAGFGLNPV